MKTKQVKIKKTKKNIYEIKNENKIKNKTKIK